MCAFCNKPGHACTGKIAENQFGFNIQAGVHLPQLMGWKTTQDIIPHFMFERVRTQDENDSTYAIDYSKNRNQVYTAGVAYLPIPKVSLKADYTHEKLGDNTSTQQFNMSVSYLY